MVKKRETGQARSIRRWGWLLALGSTVATGCSTTPTAATKPHDPLHGVLVPPTIPQPNSAKPPGSPVSQGPQPFNSNPAPIGSDYSSSNTATLAGLSGQTPLGRPLAIDDQGRALAPGQLTAGGKTQQTPAQLGYQPANANPKVETIPDAGFAPTPSKFSPTGWQPEQAAAPVVATVNAAPSTTEILTRQLRERGVVNQKVDQLPDGIHLTCYVSRSPAEGLRILEVTALDYTTAAQAILQQLDSAR